MTINLITSLPESLSCSILSDWLKVRQLVRLDSAFCARACRQQLLNLLRSDVMVNQQMWLVTGVEVFEWSLLRAVKLARFQFAIEIRHIPQREVMKTYFESYGQHIREVKAQSPVERMMDVVALHCKHLTRLRCVQPAFGNFNDLATIFRNNAHLQELNFAGAHAATTDNNAFAGIKLSALDTLTVHSQSGITDLEVAVVVMSTSLRRFSFSCLRNESMLTWRIAELCPHLRSLELNAPFVADEEIGAFVDLCPHIVNFSLCGNRSVSDAGVGARNLKLRTLCLQNCNGLTDLSVQYLAQCCSDTLILFYIDSDTITLTALDDLCMKCGQKVTIHSRRAIYREKYFEHCSTATVLHIRISFNISDSFVRKLGENCTRLEVLDLSNFPTVNLDLAIVDMLCKCCPSLRTIVLKPRDRDLYWSLLKGKLKVAIDCPGARYELDQMPM